GATDAVTRAAAAAPVTPMPPAEGPAMGFVSLKSGASSLILDAAPPPKAVTAGPHGSPLALEFTHGSQPILVSAGTGRGFGPEADAESRQMRAHSCLVLGEGVQEPHELSGAVSARVTEEADGIWALGESMAFHASTGLRHERRLHLARSGFSLSGEDTLVAGSAEERARLTSAMPEDLAPRRFAALFLAHPDIAVEPALNGRAALLRLPDGAKWMLRTDSQSVALRPVRYFETGRTHPRATKQIVVSGEILQYWARITWTLERLAPAPV
ncbi:MAG: heparinase II/III-family protein, partial [Pseudomonadota bacterium]